MNKVLLLILLILGSTVSYAQIDSSAMDADELFALAREKAFSNEHAEAIRICKIALEKSPNYTDITVFMGRVYAWGGQREQARTIFKEVLQKEPYNIDATLALADVEIWDDKPAAALTVLDHALVKAPNNSDLLYKKAKTLVALKNDSAALIVLIHALEVNPGCSECITLKRSLQRKGFTQSFAMNAAGDFFSDYYDDMYYAYVQYGCMVAKGTLFARLNFANRFDEKGLQPEFDYYHSLWKKSYGYFNYGYSNSDLFPEHRLGVEAYQTLPHSLEASAGIRYMYFDATSDVMIYTASLGWYVKNYWLNLRTYITPDSSNAVSTSFYFTGRKYFADADNYLGLIVGGGFSPDFRRIQSNTGLDAGNNIYYLGSQKIQLQYQRSIRYNMVFLIDTYLMNQELSFSYGEYVKIFGLSTTLKIRF